MFLFIKILPLLSSYFASAAFPYFIYSDTQLQHYLDSSSQPGCRICSLNTTRVTESNYLSTYSNTYFVVIITASWCLQLVLLIILKDWTSYLVQETAVVRFSPHDYTKMTSLIFLKLGGRIWAKEELVIFWSRFILSLSLTLWRWHFCESLRETFGADLYNDPDFFR